MNHLGAKATQEDTTAVPALLEAVSRVVAFSFLLSLIIVSKPRLQFPTSTQPGAWKVKRTPHVFFAESGSPWKARRVDARALSRVSPRSTLRGAAHFRLFCPANLREQVPPVRKLITFWQGKIVTDCCFQFPAQTPAASNEASLAGMKRPRWPLDSASTFLKSGFLSQHRGTISRWQWFPDRWWGRLLPVVTSICSGVNG